MCDVVLSGGLFAAKRAFLLTALRVQNHPGNHKPNLLESIGYYIYRQV